MKPAWLDLYKATEIFAQTKIILLKERMYLREFAILEKIKLYL